MVKRKIWSFLVGVGVFFGSAGFGKIMAVPNIFNPYDGCPGGGLGGNDPRVNTALGCIPVTIQGFVTWLLPLLFGIAGGISFLLMVYGFIMVATSSGDEKKVQGARETITSAIIGLVVSIFALFIFRLIAINILHIPGIN